MTEQVGDAGERIDWDEAVEHPMTPDGFRLVIRGVTPVPMTVTLRPLPVGIAPVDYQGIEVLGKAGDVNAKVETPWTTEVDTKELPHGRKGYVLVGATKRDYFPPKEETDPTGL